MVQSELDILDKFASEIMKILVKDRKSDRHYLEAQDIGVSSYLYAVEMLKQRKRVIDKFSKDE